MVGRKTRFLGTSTHSVDKKSRVFLAKRFQLCLPQDEDGTRTAVLCAGKGGCLWLFHDAGFERALERFETDAFVDEEDLQAQRDFFEYAAEVSLDSSGRLLVPQDHRELAGIREEGEVVMVGMVHRVEIWSKERWEARPRGADSPRSTRGAPAPREGTKDPGAGG